jgi:NADPH2:quinone reductase
MQAIVTTRPGGPEVLEARELAKPVLERDTDLLVRVKAAGVNPIDTKLRAKPASYPVPVPAVLGCDGAGVVEAVGAGVTDFRPGDAVYYCQPPHHERLGSYAEYVLVDQRLAARKPRGLSFTQAAAAPLVLISAWEALHDRAGVKSGDKVLVHAGAGGVGHMAIQIACIAGAEVCTTVSSAAKAELARELGAARAIDYRTEDFAPAVLGWSGGHGADIALDTVGGRALTETFRAVRRYGDVVTLVPATPEVDWNAPRLRNQRVSFQMMVMPVFFGIDAAIEHQGAILRRATELFEAGLLRVHVERSFPLAEAAAAHALLAAGGIKGKLVLTVD